MPEEEAPVIPESEPALQGRKLVRLGEDTPFYYVNNTEVGMTTWDISLRLSRIEKADKEFLYLRDQATVTMSLQHAKAVAVILLGYIQQYESVNGPLAVPIPGAGLVAEDRGGKIETEVPIALYPDAEPQAEKPEK